MLDLAEPSPWQAATVVEGAGESRGLSVGVQSGSGNGHFDAGVISLTHLDAGGVGGMWSVVAFRFFVEVNLAKVLL